MHLCNIFFQWIVYTAVVRKGRRMKTGEQWQHCRRSYRRRKVSVHFSPNKTSTVNAPVPLFTIFYTISSSSLALNFYAYFFTQKNIFRSGGISKEIRNTLQNKSQTNK